MEMFDRTVRGQSPNWPAYRLIAPAEKWTGPARVRRGTDGNLTVLEVMPDETAPIAVVGPVDFSGEIALVEGEAIIAAASSGRWSGGDKYSGWLVGRLGALVALKRKGSRRYLRATGEGWVSAESARPVVMEEAL